MYIKKYLILKGGKVSEWEPTCSSDLPVDPPGSCGEPRHLTAASVTQGVCPGSRLSGSSPAAAEPGQMMMTTSRPFPGTLPPCHPCFES